MLNNTATAEPLARWALPHERRLVARTPYIGGGAERPGSATPSIRSSDVAGMTARQRLGPLGAPAQHGHQRAHPDCCMTRLRFGWRGGWHAVCLRVSVLPP